MVYKAPCSLPFCSSVPVRCRNLDGGVLEVKGKRSSQHTRWDIMVIPTGNDSNFVEMGYAERAASMKEIRRTSIRTQRRFQGQQP